MTEPITQPATAQKKKFSPIAWVMIGCLGLLILVGGCFAVTTFFAAKKAKDVFGVVADDFKDNPAMAAAEMFVKLNPELDLVESDDEAGTLTIRNRQTGEIATLDVSDVQEGRISFEQDGEEVTFGVSEDDSGAGQITISGGDDETTIQMGTGGEGDWPEWLEPYPGTRPQSAYSTRTPDGLTGAFSMETDDSVGDVMDFYQEALADLGMEPSVSNFSGPGGEGASLNAQTEDPQRSVGITINRQEGGPTNIVVTFTEGS